MPLRKKKKKLETLKTSAEQAEQALKDGTITQDQYDYKMSRSNVKKKFDGRYRPMIKLY